MQRALLLSGYACKSWIWDEVLQADDLADGLRTLDWPTQRTRAFYGLSDFAYWAQDEVIQQSLPCDVIIGHSMGGLVALAIAQLGFLPVKKVVLVESFVTSPGVFFQNLMMDHAPKEKIHCVNEMMKVEQAFYADELKVQLRTLDLTSPISNLDCKIEAVYGDRGCSDRMRVETELGWSELLRKKIDLHIVHNACHFPMLENPTAMITLMRKIVYR